MPNVHAVVRTDNMFGVDVRSGLVSIEYMGADGKTPTAIENGNILKVGPLKDGEREIFIGSDVAADDSLKDIVLVASPELMYEDSKRNLDDFINEAGYPARGYRIHNGDIFSVTIEALDGTGEPEVGDVIELVDGTKLGFVAAETGATEGSTVVGSIIAIDVVGRYTYYAILVDEAYVPAE